MRFFALLLVLQFFVALSLTARTSSSSRSISEHLIAHNSAYNYAKQRAVERNAEFGNSLPDSTIDYEHDFHNLLERNARRIRGATNPVGHRDIFNKRKLNHVASRFAEELSDSLIFGGFFNKIGNAFKSAGNKMKQGFQKAGNNMRRGFQKAGNNMRRGFQKAGNSMRSGFQQAGNKMRVGFHKINRGFKLVGRVVKKAAIVAIHKTKEGLEKAANFIKEQAEKFVKDYIMSYGKILTQGAAVGNQAASGANKFAGTARSSFGKFGGAFGSSAAQSGQFVGDSITGAAMFAKTGGETIANFAKLMKLLNPKKIIGYIGKAIINKDDAARAIRHDLEEIKREFEREANQSRNRFAEQAKQYKNKLDKAKNALKDGLSKNFANAKSALQQLGAGIAEAGKDFVKLYEEVDKLFESHPLLKMLKSFTPLGFADQLKTLVKLGKDGKWADLVLGILDNVGDAVRFVPGVGSAISTAVSAATSLARFGIEISKGNYEEAIRNLSGVKLPGLGAVGKVVNTSTKVMRTGIKVYDKVEKIRDKLGE